MFHVVGMRKRCVENRLIEEYGSFTGFDQVLLHAWVETWREFEICEIIINMCVICYKQFQTGTERYWSQFGKRIPQKSTSPPINVWNIFITIAENAEKRLTKSHLCRLRVIFIWNIRY